MAVTLLAVARSHFGQSAGLCLVVLATWLLAVSSQAIEGSSDGNSQHLPADVPIESPSNGQAEAGHAGNGLSPVREGSSDDDLLPLQADAPSPSIENVGAAGVDGNSQGGEESLNHESPRLSADSPANNPAEILGEERDGGRLEDAPERQELHPAAAEETPLDMDAGTAEPSEVVQHLKMGPQSMAPNDEDQEVAPPSTPEAEELAVEAVRGNSGSDHHEHSPDDEKHLKDHIFDLTDFGRDGMSHVLHHLSKIITLPSDIEAASDEELIFYFFRLHDFDNNNKLDGIELMSFLSDFHNEVADKKERGPQQFETGTNAPEVNGEIGETLIKPTGPILTEDELVPAVDGILADYDFDGDGFVTFPEFISAGVRSNDSFLG